VSFTVVTCHDFIRRDDLENGHKIYPSMLKLDPDFTVHAGDVEYYDKPGPYSKSAELARYKWNRLFSLPFQKEYYRSVPVYFEKDDHDILGNDAWPGSVYGELTWDQGLAIFNEQTPTGARPYRTIRWGEHLQIWLTEGREYRSPNDMPDGPNKSIWGAEQKAWFYRTFARSDATFRIVISPTPILGPDRPKKNDNHANEGFEHEGREIRNFLAGQEGAFVICGDRHWQYATVDATRGIREFGCGAGSDSHAGGWREDQRTPEQTFLRIKGGFLRVAIETPASGPIARVQHYDVDGNLVNEVLLPGTRATADPDNVDEAQWTPAPNEKWTTLFDGSEGQLGKFHLYNQPDTSPERWSAIGDVLALASRKESPGKREKEDLVITPRGYRDFEIELDWKAGIGANGGIFYRTVEDSKFEKPWFTGLEYQLLDNANHDEGTKETHRAGDLYDLIASSSLVSYPALEWNHTRIVVRGSKFEHWLNGTLIVSADTASPEWQALIAKSKYSKLVEFARPIAGQIILQDHGDKLWFKSIRIREL
jgi:alkaline phosphatase D